MKKKYIVPSIYVKIIIEPQIIAQSGEKTLEYTEESASTEYGVGAKGTSFYSTIDSDNEE